MLAEPSCHGYAAASALSACGRSLSVGAPTQISTACPQILRGQRDVLGQTEDKSIKSSRLTAQGMKMVNKHFLHTLLCNNGKTNL